MADNKTESQLKRLAEIHKEEENLYLTRNQKYGDSFSKTFREYGPTTILIRLEDKLNRAKTLINLHMDSEEESLIDTLKDLSNYANMAILELTTSTEGGTEEKPETPKRKRRKKAETKEDKDTPIEKTDNEKGPLDDLTKKQLAEVVRELEGEIPKKASRSALISIINGFSKAQVAVIITSILAKERETEKENGDGGEE